MDLTPELALALCDSEEEHPVDFDDAWQWIGYVNKQAAKKKLTRNFKAKTDYLSKWMSVAHINGSTASKSEKITLTVDCFKSLAMMAGTAKGREARQYFLDCEKQLKRLVAEKSIRDLNIDANINIQTDPHSNQFRPDFIEEIRQIRLEVERIKNDIFVIDPEFGRYLIGVIRDQTALKFGIELYSVVGKKRAKPIVRPMEPIEFAASKTEADFTEIDVSDRKTIGVADIERFVAEEVFGKEGQEIILQGIVQNLIAKLGGSNTDRRSVLSRAHYALLKQGWQRLRTDRVDKGKAGRFTFSIYGKL